MPTRDPRVAVAWALRVATRGGAYGVASLARALGALLSVPVILRAGGLGEYGWWALLEPMLPLIAGVSLLGLDVGVLQIIAVEKVAPDAAFRGAIRGSLLHVAAVSALSAYVWFLLLGEPLFAVAWSLAVLAEAYCALALGCLRAAARPWSLAGVATVRSGGFLLGLLLAEGRVELSTQVVLSIWMGGSVAALGLALILLGGHPRGSLQPMSLGAGRRYGLPILLASLAVGLVWVLDRQILYSHASAEDVGAYAVHVRIAQTVNVLVTAPVALWWPAARLSREVAGTAANAFYRKAIMLGTVTYAVASCSVWLGGPLIGGLIAPSVGLDPMLLALILFGICGLGLGSHVWNVGLLRPGATQLNVVAPIVALITLGTVAFFGAPHMGPRAVALGVAAAGGVYLAGMHGLSQKVHPVAVPYPRVVGAVALCLVGTWGLEIVLRTWD